MDNRPIAPDHQHLDLTASPSFLGLYTQLCLCYNVPDESYHASITKKLENGLEKLSTSFPWIAGQVVKEGVSTKMKPLRRMPSVVVRDFTKDPSFPTMAQYQAARFPFSMLDESVICPVNTLPAEFAQGSAPIFFVQVNFIQGGMLLTFTAEHSVMDMTGQSQVISLLSKACKNASFTEAELSDGNVDRRTIFKLLDNYEPGPELDHQIKKPVQYSVEQGSKMDIETQDGTATENEDVAKSVWAYFGFSNDALKELKQATSMSLTSGYVSTDDSICALIWQCVSRARLKRFASNVESTFARAVDVRRFLGVSKTYLGLLDNMTYHTQSLQQLADASLGGLASGFRRAIDPTTTQLEYNTRSFATAFNQAEDKSTFGPIANQQPDRDIALSSWANINSYGVDFGFGIGKPVSVRRPRFAPVEGLMYLMPRDAKGDSAAAICLRVEDMEALKVDPDFIKYAAFVG